MNFIGEHERWCQSKGVNFKDPSDLAPAPEFDPNDYPEQLRQWHQSRFAERLPDWNAVELAFGLREGYGLGPHQPSEDPAGRPLDDGAPFGRVEFADLLSNTAEEHALLMSMRPFAQSPEGLLSVRKSDGDRDGWVYSFGMDSDFLYRPAATSISQYLYLIRQFTDAGLLGTDENNPTWQIDRSQTWPPPDTPIFLMDPRYDYERTTGNFYAATVDMRSRWKRPPLGPEMSGSYLDIAPDFTPVNHLDALP